MISKECTLTKENMKNFISKEHSLNSLLRQKVSIIIKPFKIYPFHINREIAGCGVYST